MRRSYRRKVVLRVLIAGALASALVSTAPAGGASGAAPAVAQDSPRIAGELGDQAQPEQIPSAAWERMLGSIEGDRYAVRPAGFAAKAETYEALNPPHGLRANFAQDGVRVRPASDGESSWEWSLQLERFGYEGSLEPVEAVAPVADGNRVEYRRGSLTEWYVNEPRGLEQGFTVAEAPERTAPAAGGLLVLELRTAGMESRQGLAGESIVLVTDEGSRTLLLRGLVAWDARGISLPAEMWATEEGIRMEVDDRGASYPLTIDPFIESTIVPSPDGDYSDSFGSSVGISGETAIVGALREDGGPGDYPDIGAAYIFARNQGGAGNWGLVKKLAASDAQVDDLFGSGVAISGDTAIVGALGEDGGPGDPLPGAGAAYIFERNQGGTDNWGEVKKLIASDGQADDRLGASLAISGDTAVIGAPGWPSPGAGAAYVFERGLGGAGNWGEAAKLVASDPGWYPGFGDSVGISGDTVIVGNPAADGGPGGQVAGAGAGYVFERNYRGAGYWGEVKKLYTFDGQSGDRFGDSAAISGNTAIIGAPREDPWPQLPFGAAYVFDRGVGGAGNWGAAAKLVASDPGWNDYFGDSVAILGDTAIVTAPAEDGGPGNPLRSAGAAYVFERTGGGVNNWRQVTKINASDAEVDDLFGESVAISDATAFIGTSQAAAAYVFDHTNWAYVLDGLGGLHATGTSVVPITPAPPYFGFDVARDAELSGNGAYVLDGFGGVHAAGGEPVLTPGPPYFGFDIAKDFELAPGGGGYSLDGFGGVIAIGGAPVLSPATFYFGWDVARDLELGGGGYYVLDGFGGVHTGGGASPITPRPPYFGFDIARDLELVASGGGGYALDGYGGVHVLGGAPALNPPTPYFGWDVAKDLELAYGGGHYVLDSHGGVHAGGGAMAISPAPPYFGFDIARDLEIR